MFLDHVASKSIKAYVSQGTEEHNQTYVPQGSR
jgi:hypothetical protein